MRWVIAVLLAGCSPAPYHDEFNLNTVSCRKMCEPNAVRQFSRIDGCICESGKTRGPLIGGKLD